MQKMIKGIVEGDVIRPLEKVTAKEVFIISPEKKKINLDKIKTIKVDPALIDQIIEDNIG